MSIYSEKPWLAYYDATVPKTMDYPNESVHGQLERTARKFGDRVATITSARLPLLGRVAATLTWRELDDAASRFAAGLAARGLKKGDVVALILPNSVQFIIAFYGTLKAGGIVSATNPTYPPDRMAYQINNAGARVLVALTSFYQGFKSVQSQTRVEYVIATNIKEYLPPLARTLFTLAKEKKDGHFLENVASGDVWFQEFIAQHTAAEAPQVPVDPSEDTAIFQYTGGTTGISKGAMSTHAAVAANTNQLEAWFPSQQPENEVLLGAIPFFHVYGMITVVAYGAHTGARIIIVPNARDISDVVDCIVTYKPTIFTSVPALYNAINNHPSVVAGKADLSSFQYCFSGSAPLAPDTKRRFEELTGATILEGFGMSEAPTVTHANPLGRPGKNQSIGTPFPDVECMIINLDDGVTPMPVGEPGELVMRSPNLMRGYMGMPTETANALRDLGDGGGPWLFTGDIAYMDDEGYFFIVDRKKDMALIGGYNVYPNMVEKAIADHPAVNDVGVTAIPHPDKPGQEALLACVVLAEGYSGDDALRRDLVEFQNTRLAQYEVARRIVFVDELPKTSVGKTLRRELSKLAAQLESAG